MGELLTAVAAAVVARYLIVEPAMKASGFMGWLEEVRPKTRRGAGIAGLIMGIPMWIAAFVIGDVVVFCAIASIFLILVYGTFFSTAPEHKNPEEVTLADFKQQWFPLTVMMLAMVLILVRLG
jgi:hypothetical protein